MNKGLNKYKTFINYLNTNKIINILTSVLIALFVTFTSYLICKYFGSLIDVFGICLTIIILTILSFVFQNNDHDYVYFLTFLVLLFLSLIILDYDFCVNRHITYYENIDLSPTFVTCLIVIFIIVYSKVKYEDTTPYILIFKDFIHAKFDAKYLKKYMNSSYKISYTDLETNYLKKMNSAKESLFNNIQSDYMFSVTELKTEVFELKNKKNLYDLKSEDLNEKLNIIDKTYDNPENSGKQKYHLLNKREKLLTDKLNYDNDLHEIENQIYRYERMIENYDNVYELEMIQIENDYTNRYRNYKKIVEKKLKKENKPFNIKSLIDVKKYLKRGGKDELSKGN